MADMPMSISKRESELFDYLARQPYVIEQDDIRLTIAKNVFPSDFGLTSSFFGNFMLQQQPAADALDMGCGSGYFAFLLRKIGCENVFGVDFNPDAVHCARENTALNPELEPIDFIHSDLFTHVPARQFGIVVFNFNYYPSNGVFGLYEDGGNKILERFFAQVDEYITPETRIYIPYSEFVGDEHDPKHVARRFGYTVDTLATTSNQAGRHCIYLVTKAD